MRCRWRGPPLRLVALIMLAMPLIAAGRAVLAEEVVEVPDEDIVVLVEEKVSDAHPIPFWEVTISPSVP